MSNMQVFTLRNLAAQLKACLENTTNTLDWLEGDMGRRELQFSVEQKLQGLALIRW